MGRRMEKAAWDRCDPTPCKKSDMLLKVYTDISINFENQPGPGD